VNDPAQVGRAFGATVAISWMIALRQLRTEWRQSRLSIFWPLITPLAYTLLFVLMRPVLGLALQSGAESYALFVFVGFSLWQSWFEALRATMDALRRNKSLVVRGEIDSTTVLLSSLFVSAVPLVFRLVAAAILAGAMGSPALAIGSLFAMGIAVLLNGAVIGSLLQPFASLSPDVAKFLQSISLGLMLTGAVFVRLPPEPAETVRWLLALNPMGALLNAARAPLFSESLAVPTASFIWLGITFALCAVALRVTKRTLPVVVERMGG
jgi:lipopolysaccharide transport system permease protein